MFDIIEAEQVDSGIHRDRFSSSFDDPSRVGLTFEDNEKF